MKPHRYGRCSMALALVLCMMIAVIAPASRAEAKSNTTITLAVGDTLRQSFNAKIKSIKSSKSSVVSVKGKNTKQNTMKAKKKGKSTIKIKFKKQKKDGKTYKYKSKTFDVKVVKESMKMTKSPIVNNYQRADGKYDTDVIFTIKNTGGIIYNGGIVFNYTLQDKDKEEILVDSKIIKYMIPGKTAQKLVTYKGLEDPVMYVNVTGWEANDSSYCSYVRKDQSKKVTATKTSGSSASATYYVKNSSGVKIYGEVDYVFTDSTGRIIGVETKTIKLKKNGQAIHQITKPDGTSKITVNRRAFSQKKIKL